jgi:hypothetical protein
MRTKSLLFTAAFTAATMGSAFAAPVYSANVVGYINITAPVGLSLIANQLDNKSGNKLPDVITKLPDGAFVHFYVGGAAGFKSVSYFGGYEGDPATFPALAPGGGAFLEIPGGTAEADRKITFVGEVLQGAASNGSVPNGLSIVSSKTPRAGKVSTDLKFPSGGALDGSLLYRYINTAAKKDYEASSIFGGWEGVEPSVAVGESFFFFNASGAAQAWNQDFTVQ